MYFLIPKGGISLVTCVGDLEASKTLLCGLQGSISNSLQDWKKIWDRIQTYLMGENISIKDYSKRFEEIIIQAHFKEKIMRILISHPRFVWGFEGIIFFNYGNRLREKWSCIYELLISFSKQLMYKYECYLSIWGGNVMLGYVMLWLERIVSHCDLIDWDLFIVNVSSNLFVFSICYLFFVAFHTLFFFYAISYF